MDTRFLSPKRVLFSEALMIANHPHGNPGRAYTSMVPLKAIERGDSKCSSYLVRTNVMLE